jgi:hypothetical protein
MKAEEYEAAVNKVLEAFGLDAAEVTGVCVEPHRTVVTKVKREDDKRVLFTEVINRDDVKAGPAFASVGITVEGLAKAIAEVTKDNISPNAVAKALGLYNLATGK